MIAVFLKVDELPVGSIPCRTTAEHGFAEVPTRLLIKASQVAEIAPAVLIALKLSNNERFRREGILIALSIWNNGSDREIKFHFSWSL